MLEQARVEQRALGDLVGVAQRMKTLVGALSEVDWEKVNLDKDERNPWMASQAGFAGQADLYKTLYAWVYYGKPLS